LIAKLPTIVGARNVMLPKVKVPGRETPMVRPPKAPTWVLSGGAGVKLNCTGPRGEAACSSPR
jgi:hypothetical protein